VLALELVDEVAHHAVVEVLAAQVGVASGGLDLNRRLYYICAWRLTTPAL
jgi:hypothetical protein